jgi:amino acid transporter
MRRQAYEGIAVPGEVAGEFKKPARDLPLSLSVGITIVMAMYTSVNTGKSSELSCLSCY